MYHELSFSPARIVGLGLYYVVRNHVLYYRDVFSLARNTLGLDHR